MLKLIFAGVILPAIAAAGCVNIPDSNWIVSQRGDVNTTWAADNCDAGQPAQSPVATSEQYPGLDPRGFSLLSWNILKGQRENWAEDFRRFSDKKDLIIIQEARLSDSMRNLLEEMNCNWDLAASFEYKHAKTGVLTVSKIEPGFVCVLQSKEPLIRIPKTILVTRYPISGTNQYLLVANVHLINFTLTTSHFRAQLQQLETLLSAHQGPVVVSGDFNTWSDERMQIVRAAADRLDLKTVTFEENTRVTVMGHKVDHIYYRGLKLIEAGCVTVKTSDHNPLMARFRMADTP
jgi:endonuclease/exonuclease/phosphatase (EEP) superfamily protein YafD